MPNNLNAAETEHPISSTFTKCGRRNNSGPRFFVVRAENWVIVAAIAAKKTRRLHRRGTEQVGAASGSVGLSAAVTVVLSSPQRPVALVVRLYNITHRVNCINRGNMQANGSGQSRCSELSCRNGAQNGDSYTTGVAHTNGLVSVTNNGNTVSNNNGVLAQPTTTNNTNSTSDASSGVKKKKRLSQSEEDVIRLIGQHLHDLGLK